MYQICKNDKIFVEKEEHSLKLMIAVLKLEDKSKQKVQ